MNDPKIIAGCPVVGRENGHLILQGADGYYYYAYTRNGDAFGYKLGTSMPRRHHRGHHSPRHQNGPFHNYAGRPSLAANQAGSQSYQGSVSYENPDDRRIRELATIINRNAGSVGSGRAIAEFYALSLAAAGFIVFTPMVLGGALTFAAETVGGYYATAFGTVGVVLGRYPQYIEGAADSVELNALNLPPRLFTLFDYFGKG